MVIHCAICQTEFRPGEDRCSVCGSSDAMIGAYSPGGARVSAARPDPSSLTDGATVFWLKGKDDPAYKPGRQFLRHNIKVEWSSQRHQLEYVERIFNKAEGIYTERYYDPKTGAITFVKEGPIDDQTLHSRRGRGS